jgi:hypothetical protein
MSLPSSTARGYSGFLMDYKELVKVVGVSETRLRNWRTALLRAGLINPQRGIRDKFLFSDEDVKQFLKLKELLENGAKSVPEAIRMMQQNITPGEALSKYMQAQRQIEVLQRKILQLRKPFWKRILDWFRGLFARGLSRQPG